MYKNDCIFCKIADKSEEAVILYEDDYSMAIADIFPLTRGHALVIPKRHFTNIYELDDEYAAHLFKTTAKVARRIKDILKPDGINIHQSNEKAAGQEVFHIHIHIIPRYLGQKLFIFNVERRRASTDEIISVFRPLLNEM